MNAPVTSRLRPVVTLIVLCAALMSMTACFVLNIFGGGGDGLSDDGVTPIGDVTAFEVASALHEAGRFDESLVVYLEAIQSDPTSIVASNAMNEIGRIYLDRGEYEKSLQAYKELLAQFPTYEGAEEVQKKLEFVKKAFQVQRDREKIAKEGTSIN
ncbi:MAG: tetratricopeptide repeat protein [Gemmatimonadota bacterium]|nr:tetratricopeptide repeat protein [Gemmatimonadota bacterium]